MKSRFMSDKIMPLSQAVEGYELFDNMKVQKGISTISIISKNVLTRCSGVRSTKVTRKSLAAQQRDCRKMQTSCSVIVAFISLYQIVSCNKSGYHESK